VAAAVIVEEVTEKRRSEKALSEARQQIQEHAEALERTVSDRTAKLKETVQELEAFSYSASHDLRAPVRTIQGFAQLIAEDDGNQLTPESVSHLSRIGNAAQRMDALIRDLLVLARISTATLARTTVDLSKMAEEVGQALAAEHPDRSVRFVVTPGATAFGDPGLLRIALENLLSNAWKFTARRQDATVHFGCSETPATNGATEFYVRDDGAGFPSERASTLFAPFQRLHSGSEFPGVGIGLATVRRIIARHGGAVRAEGAVGRGATFWFSLEAEKGSQEAEEYEGRSTKVQVPGSKG
jgi:light-regulated signal transduction histidine kinase (bacteriophytochrome)